MDTSIRVLTALHLFVSTIGIIAGVNHGATLIGTLAEYESYDTWKANSLVMPDALYLAGAPFVEDDSMYSETIFVLQNVNHGFIGLGAIVFLLWSLTSARPVWSGRRARRLGTLSGGLLVWSMVNWSVQFYYGIAAQTDERILFNPDLFFTLFGDDKVDGRGEAYQTLQLIVYGAVHATLLAHLAVVVVYSRVTTSLIVRQEVGLLPVTYASLPVRAPDLEATVVVDEDTRATSAVAPSGHTKIMTTRVNLAGTVAGYVGGKNAPGL